MISRFFIDRPIFAAVMSIAITLAGLLCLLTLPLAQFPPISPPTVQVSCTYAGASAKEVADAIAAPIEQQVNGVENMMYMSSQCANDGTYALTVTFRPGVNLNMAQVLVQNRVSLATPSLPDVIKATGVSVLKRSPDILMGLAIISPDGRYDQLYLSNYAVLQLKDELARLPGVGDVFIFGQRDYSMRVWVDPDELAGRHMTALDVVNAVSEQNVPVAAGSLGQEPIVGGQKSQVTLTTLGRLSYPEQFENIVVKTMPDGRIVRTGDVAKVSLGAKSLDTRSRLDGHDAVFVAIFQRPDANALELHDLVLAKMDDLKKSFPEGLDYEVGFDTTPYTRESIKEVVKTLRDSVMLVALVVLVFLQNWRSAVIPLFAVPVAIIGTFVAMAAFGFSLNNLTLFGLVLAIGIVVDDAIVVVEAVEHHIELGMAPREASIEAMRQVTGPVIAVGLVLSAVFVPCAFIAGITGAFFRQFALAIAVSTLISAFNSLTLSPALTALLLRPLGKETGRQGDRETRRPGDKGSPLPRLVFAVLGGWLCWHYLEIWSTELLVSSFSSLPASLSPGLLVSLSLFLIGAIIGWFVGKPLNWLLSLFFGAFHRAFQIATNGYVRLVGGLLRISVIVLLVYCGLLGTTWWEFTHTPRGFIPMQDMGYLFVSVQLPDCASVERTDAVIRQIEAITMATPGIKHVAGIVGLSFAISANGSNFGTIFINLDDYPLRRDPSRSAFAIAGELQRRCSTEIADASVFVASPPPVRVGVAGGFVLMIEDRGDLGPVELQRQTENLIQHGYGDKDHIAALFSAFRANVPQLRIEPDPGACMIRGVSLKDFADTLGIYEGSLYVNDFNRFGRTWQVIVQANDRYRRQPESIPLLKTRNARGNLVPIGSLAEQRLVNGPLVLTRYNMYTAATVNGFAKPGTSSRDIIDIMENLAKRELPPSMAFEWTQISYLELMAGNTALSMFGLAVVMVFLVLAAQYESWSLPLAVILVVPMCLLSAVLGVGFAHQDINIFTQIGLVVLVGLASKNAVLIVEYARRQRHQGSSRRDATLAACRLRLRPIVMTSLAFILGVSPLIFAVGAGAEMRRALGTAVFGGMVGVTLFGILLTPVFFAVVDHLGEARVFHLHWVKRFNVLVLGLLTLRPFREAARNVKQHPGKVTQRFPGREPT